MKFKEFKEKLSGGIRKRDLAWEIGLWILEGRVIKGITQEKLAKMVKTKQPSIARVENGSVLPSLRFLQKIAKALDLELPKFEPKVKEDSIDSSSTAEVKHFHFLIIPSKDETQIKSSSDQKTEEVIK